MAIGQNSTNYYFDDLLSTRKTGNVIKYIML